MQNYYTNIDKDSPVNNVPDYQQANHLTRYTATQIAIWKLTGANFNNIVIESNPLIQQLYEEAKEKTDDNDSYQEIINKIDNIEINVKEIVPNGEDKDNYYYNMIFEDNMDAETEKLVEIDDKDTNIQVQLLNDGKVTDITNEVSIQPDFARRTIKISIPKKIIDENKASDSELYCNIDALIRSKESYYVVYYAKPILQPIGTLQPIEKRLVTRASIDFDSSETSFSVLKHWDDRDNQDGLRPQNLAVQLYQSDQPYSFDQSESITTGKETKFGDIKYLDEANDWEYIWKNLPLKNENGQTAYYTVREEFDSKDYNLSIQTTDGGKALYLKNEHTPEKVTIEGEKVWDDSNNQDGIRPQDISVQLYANGKESGKPVTLNEGNKWQYTWKELDEKKNGKTIEYIVKEVDVPEGYTATVTDDGKGHITLTNSHNVSKVPGTNGSGTTSRNGTTNNNKPNLPSTGEDHSMSPIFYGAGILLMSMGAFYIRRKH